jgi:hypothetical protein
MLTYGNLNNYGRFGNQLFQIASTIGLAVKHGYEFQFPEWENQKYFKHKLPGLNRSIQHDQDFEFGYHEHELKPNTNIRGYLQSEKYFQHCSNLIRHYFDLIDIETPEIPEDAVCIHVRRGDYDGDYLALLTREYYIKAVTQLASRPLYLFSDEPKKAKELIPFVCEVIEGNDFITDFAMMTKFKYHIIANSSFSWWAYWLAKDKIKCVAPLNWFGSKLNFTTKDIYTDEMIIS